MADDRSKAIELALSGLEKQFGKGSIMRLGLEGCCADFGHFHGFDLVRCGAGGGWGSAGARD